MEISLDKSLKQRLLGAVILAALLVILVPEWLDGAGHRSRYPQNIQMRDKPVFKPMRAVTSDASTKINKTNPETGTRKHSSIQAWALQVGSFKDRVNADALKDRLIAKGFSAYVDLLKAPDHITYRVRIGPALDRTRLEKVQKNVLKAEKLEGMIVNHP